jgi:type II secretory pathway component PulC
MAKQNFRKFAIQNKIWSISFQQSITYYTSMDWKFFKNCKKVNKISKCKELGKERER